MTMSFRLLIVASFVFVTLPSLLAASPVITDRLIRFSSGKTISHDSTVKHIQIEEWQRILFIKTTRLFEGGKNELSIYSNDGKKILPKYEYCGNAIILKTKKRILLAQQSAHNLIEKSFLLDQNGTVLKTIAQSQNVFEFGKSDDDNIFWILSRTIEQGKALTVGNVYDFNGNLIHTFKTDTEETEEIPFGHNKYKIGIKKPEIPG